MSKHQLRTADQNAVLLKLHAPEPWPHLEMTANWLIGYLEDGHNHPNSTIEDRRQLIANVYKLLEGKKVCYLRHCYEPGHKVGQVRSITGRPPLIEGGRTKDIGPVQLDISWGKQDFNLVTLNKLCIEGELTPIWPLNI